MRQSFLLLLQMYLQWFSIGDETVRELIGIYYLSNQVVGDH